MTYMETRNGKGKKMKLHLNNAFFMEMFFMDVEGEYSVDMMEYLTNGEI
jgi:hypothetical protein